MQIILNEGLEQQVNYEVVGPVKSHSGVSRCWIAWCAVDTYFLQSKSQTSKLHVDFRSVQEQCTETISMAEQLTQHVCAPVHRERSTKTWMSEFNVPSLSGWDQPWRWCNEPGFVIQPLKEWSKFPTNPVRKNCGKPSQKGWSSSSFKGWAANILNPMD